MSKEKRFKDDTQIDDPCKRKTLKTLGAIAYAAPATMLLVTADRATAQSIIVPLK